MDLWPDQSVVISQERSNENMNTKYRIVKYPLRVVLIAMAILFFVSQTQSSFKFRDLKCRTIDKDYSSFEYCYLKAVNRSFNYMSVKANVFQFPINNVTIRWALLKRANGYKPFLYNITVDACRFLKSPKSLPVFEYFYRFFAKHSNMNHTCPYNHDLVVDKLHNLHIENLFDILPMPTGRYAIYSQWFTYGVLRTEVDIFGDKD